MKNNTELINILKSLLEDELTAINQFMVHSEMCGNLGYKKLHDAIQKQAMDQMLHAEWLIERISFLDSPSSLSDLNTIMIGKTVSEMICKTKSHEPHGFRACKDAIKLASEVDDQDTVELLNRILKMEEGHVGWAEIQRELIGQNGLENYLITQTGHLVH